MRRFACIFLALAGICSVALSQGPTDASKLDYAQLQSTYDANSALWKSKGSDCYSMKYQVSCFCPAEYREPVMVQVVDGKVKCAVYAEGSSMSGKAKYNGTIQSLFDGVKKAIAGKYCDIRVSYDSELGYPTSVYTASSCFISDMPTVMASDVRVGKKGTSHHSDSDSDSDDDDRDGHDDDHHHHHHSDSVCGGHGRRRHRLVRILFLCGGVALLVGLTVLTVCCVRRYRRRSRCTKSVGDAKYLNLQEEGVQVDSDVKKVPLV